MIRLMELEKLGINGIKLPILDILVSILMLLILNFSELLKAIPIFYCYSP